MLQCNVCIARGRKVVNSEQELLKLRPHTRWIFGFKINVLLLIIVLLVVHKRSLVGKDVTNDRNCVHRKMWNKSCFLARQPLVGLGFVIIEVRRSYSVTSYWVGLLWTSDRSAAETSTWWHVNNHNRHTSRPTEGFEPTNPGSKSTQTPRLRPRSHLGHKKKKYTCDYNSSAQCTGYFSPYKLQWKGKYVTKTEERQTQAF